MITVVSGPSENAKHLTREEVTAIMDKVAKKEIEPYRDEVTDATLISEELPGSKIVSTKKLAIRCRRMDTGQWSESSLP